MKFAEIRLVVIFQAIGINALFGCGYLSDYMSLHSQNSVALEIITKPDNPTSSSSANFTFRPIGKDIFCKLNSEPQAACTNGISFSNLSPGTYSVTFSSGSTALGSYTWKVNAPPTKIMTVTSNSPSYAHVFEVDSTTKRAVFKSKVAVGDSANFGGISANKKWAFTVNMGPSTMSVINVQDSSNISVASTFTLAAVPRVMATHPSLSKVYYSDNLIPGTIYTLDQDPSTGVLTQQGSGVAVTSRVRGIQITPNGKFMYVANWYSSEISIFTINQTTGALTLQSTVPTCSGSVSFATNPGGTVLYVACSWSSEIGAYSIDQTTGALSALAGSPFAGVADNLYLAVSPDGKFLVSSNGWGGNSFTVHNINLGTGALSGATTTALSGPSTASVFSSAGDFAYFSVWNSNGDLVGYEWSTSGLGAQISLSLPSTLTDLNHLVIW